MDDMNIPREWRKPWPKDGDPVYFAVLEAAWRHPDAANMPTDAPNRYRRCHPLDPLANEFRACFHMEYGMCSMPIGKDRERAEAVIHALNEAFNFGMVHAKRRAEDTPAGHARMRRDPSAPSSHGEARIEGGTAPGPTKEDELRQALQMANDNAAEWKRRAQAAPAWQGLTKDEHDKAVGDLIDYGTGFVAPLYAVVEGIERKLRERNAPASCGAPADAPRTEGGGACRSPGQECEWPSLCARRCCQYVPPRVDSLDAIPTNWELSYGSDDEEDQPLWRVHRRHGSTNDREWTLLGTGKTPSAAIAAAGVSGTSGGQSNG